MTNVRDKAVFESGVYRFGSPYDATLGDLGGFFASKSFTAEDASQRAKWRSLVCHGVGTLSLSVYVDNVLVLDHQSVVMSEMPTQQRVINLPRGGRCTGYNMRYEYYLTEGHVRFVELFYENVSSDLN